MLRPGSHSRNFAAIGALLWNVLLFGENASHARDLSIGVDQQFAEIQLSLSVKADRLIGNADVSGVPTIATEDPVPENRSISDSTEIKSTPAQSGPGSAAISRLELLRPQIQPILRSEGLPDAIAAVILIESRANPTAMSPKGARGLWQLMPETARRYGLAVDGVHDERLDIQKSTGAAARYLKDLHLRFRSWPLALAAYNTGEQNLQQAINRTHIADFSVLSSLGILPMETRRYVPSVLSAMGSLGSFSDSPADTQNNIGTTLFALTAE